MGFESSSLWRSAGLPFILLEFTIGSIVTRYGSSPKETPFLPIVGGGGYFCSAGLESESPSLFDFFFDSLDAARSASWRFALRPLFLLLGVDPIGELFEVEETIDYEVKSAASLFLLSESPRPPMLMLGAALPLFLGVLMPRILGSPFIVANGYASEWLQSNKY